MARLWSFEYEGKNEEENDLEEGYIYCGRCGKEIAQEDAYSFDDVDVCEDCFEYLTEEPDIYDNGSDIGDNPLSD
jgi:hypothetical protein